MNNFSKYLLISGADRNLVGFASKTLNHVILNFKCLITFDKIIHLIWF